MISTASQPSTPSRRPSIAAASANALKEELSRVFDALHTQGIRYCVFRDQKRLAEVTVEKEIDLLVDPRHLNALRQMLRGMRFFEIPSWGHEPHKFFVTYLQPLGIWLKLDVITALRLGKPTSALELEYTKDFLDHRATGELAYTPAVDTEFFVLLLKCIVNDGTFPEDRFARLQELFEEIRIDSNLQQRIESSLDRLFGDVFPWSAVVRVFGGSEKDDLLHRRSAVMRQLFVNQPFLTVARYLRIRMLKWFRPMLYFLFHRGVSVALLAPDGAGKSTVAQALGRQRMLNARLIYMGTNVKASNIGFPTTARLHQLQKSPEMNPLTRLLVAVGSFPNRLLEQWFRCAVGYYHVLRGRVVVFDRYVYDSWISPAPTSIRKKVRRFLIDRTCPTPDLVLLLDAPGETLYARKGEHNPEALEQKRQAYLSLQKALPNMVVVDATREAADVQHDVIHRVWQHWQAPIG